MTAGVLHAGATPRPSFELLTPIAADYATLPVLDGFNWADCFRTVEAGCWYLVVFRSVRREGADTDLLTEFDDHAYDEALGSGGLLHYFKGSLGPRRECLSFCVWESREQARAALRLPRHIAAARLAATMYESYGLERYMLCKHAGERAPRMHHID